MITERVNKLKQTYNPSPISIWCRNSSLSNLIWLFFVSLYFCGKYELYAEVGQEPVLFPQKKKRKKKNQFMQNCIPGQT